MNSNNLRTMRYTRFIVAILALLSTTACFVDNTEDVIIPTNDNDVVTVIGRITRFDEYDVTTRGVKDEAEAKLTSMAMALFPVVSDDNGGLTTGPCHYYQYTANQAELLFTIDRTVEEFDKNARYAMYVFTNMPGMGGFKKGDSLEDMLAVAYSVDDIDIPENGFPMIGSLGDTFSKNIDQDGNIFILAPTVDGTDNTDLIAPKKGTSESDLKPQTLLTIPMKAMYAKVNFTIEVSPDQTIEGNYSPQFTFEGCTINNVPSTVDFSNATNSDSAVLTDSFSVAVLGNTVASGANKINFSFYLPERLLSPTNNTSTNPYDYTQHGFEKRTDWGSQIDANGNGYRDEDEDYFQRFKSFLLSDSQKATNIVLSGRFRDHQNHYWNVDYTIFLGANNTNDFNIVRNAEYNNIVTIRGIQSSDDMSDNGNAISIDHRVNITRSQPAIISLRREVLLDSHFEVRPLRVRKSDIGDVGNINAVKVEVVNPKTTNWMRLERSFGDGTPDGSPQTTVNGVPTSIYIDDDANSASYGKRKFFTYNLIDGVNANATDATLVNSTEVILPLTDATECCWIYVDECTEADDAVRAGQIRVTYGTLSGSTFTATTNSAFPVVNYIINQRKLFEVVGTNTYHIEYEEEYLHNFDADDNYGETDYEGMQWGLNGVQLSYDIKAVVSQSGSFDDLKDWFMGDYIPYYDFYTSLDTEVMPTASNRRPYSGYTFCNEIIQEVNGATGNDTDTSNDINILQLDEQPKSAIEYCFNKNKRNNKGQVVWQNTDGTYDQSQLNWYLPAVDEIQDIVMSKYGSGLFTYARFLEFQEKFYWSSQPAYYKGRMHYAIGNDILVNIAVNDYANLFIDNPERARSTSVYYRDGQFGYEPSDTYGFYNILYISGSMTNNTAVNYVLYDEISDGETSFSYQYISEYTGGFMGIGSKPVYKDATYTRDDFPTFDEGNKLRSDYARVRCVRKAN